MATDPFRIKRVITKLEQAWQLAPNRNIGAILEEVEDLAWQYYYRAQPTRYFSERLMNLDDAAFEAGLNDWIKGHVNKEGVVVA